MSIIRLRKLSFKSVLDFGKFQHHSVQQVLDLREAKYLIWLYYNQSNISFTDDVLQLLHLTGERTITKPGKSDAAAICFSKECLRLYLNGKTDKELEADGRMILKEKHRNKKHSKMNSEAAERILNSKGRNREFIQHKTIILTPTG